MPNEILIHVPDEALKRGESVTIPIVLRLENPTKVRGIHAQFHAAEETKATYTTTTSNGKGQTTTTTHTTIEHVDITQQQQLLAGRERAGFFANLFAYAIPTTKGGDSGTNC